MSTSAYKDTLGDLALALVGSFVGGIAVATLLWGAVRSSSAADEAEQVA